MSKKPRFINRVTYNGEYFFLHEIDQVVEYINLTLEKFQKTGDLQEFIKALKNVVKAKMSIESLATEINFDRSNLSRMLNGQNDNYIFKLGTNLVLKIPRPTH